ncbi:hypothetical protein IC006_0113 [Sulfuracidifex tepidarius]|uniref:Uncharacterized protein n=1 Tax=Sulfuracidifex tepidarius TaxID=1294262 RepID=A0A510DRM1_9CREN|nr:hypothetical protein IC006_0113 [Sulfuracidifex tepidarius]
MAERVWLESGFKDLINTLNKYKTGESDKEGIKLI